MKLQQIFTALLLFTCGLLMTGCDDEEVVLQPELDFLNVVEVPCTGGKTSINYTLANSGEGIFFEPKTDADWISSFDTQTNGIISFEVAPNDTKKQREAIVTISCTEMSQPLPQFVVKQNAAGAPKLTLETEKISISRDGEIKVVSYTVDEDKEGIIVKAESENNWIEELKADKGKISFKVGANNVTQDRQAKIVVTATYLGVSSTKELNVTQEAALMPEIKLEKDNIIVPSTGKLIGVGYTLINAAKDAELSVSCDEKWIDNLKAELDLLSFEATENTSEEARSAKIILNLKSNGLECSTELLVKQKGVSKRSDITITVKGQTFKMVYVEGGSFTMGATPEQGTEAMDNEKPAHQVTLSGYYMAETEVTQGLYKAIMGTNPSLFKTSDNHPVERLSYFMALEFIKKLNDVTGKHFSLPTEAQWEFAARGGISSKGYKYSGSNNADDVAWSCFSSPGEQTQPVKGLKANELGLYDMSGNVGEWCADWAGTYSEEAQENPVGPNSGKYRILRGGGWGNYTRNCRVSYRSECDPSVNYSSYYGLRLSMMVED